MRDGRFRRWGAYTERLGAIEWSLLALIVLGVVITIAMAILDPS